METIPNTFNFRDRGAVEVGASRENLCFAWSGDFESLKLFIKEDLKLDGTWSHPGGDKKLFSTENITISWRRSKSILWLRWFNDESVHYDA